MSLDHAATSQEQQFIGFIIDPQGQEVAITEQMILSACEEFEKSLSNSPASSNTSND